MTTALSIGGGGSHGAWAVGAIKALRERGITFDAVYGTSVGALIAPFALLDEISLIETTFARIVTNDIIVNYDPLHVFNLVANEALFSSAPLRKLIESAITEDVYTRLVNHAGKCTVVSTNLYTGDAEYFSPYSSMIGAMSRETFLRCVLASSSQPIIFPSVRIRSDGAEFVDGGVRVVVPSDEAIRDGADTLYAICLSPVAFPVGDLDYSILAKLERTIEIFLREITRQDLESARLRAIDVNAKLIVLRPEAEFEANGLTFEPTLARKWIDQGYAETQSILRHL
jgi:NTE family protein